MLPMLHVLYSAATPSFLSRSKADKSFPIKMKKAAERVSGFSHFIDHVQLIILMIYRVLEYWASGRFPAKLGPFSCHSMRI